MCASCNEFDCLGVSISACTVNCIYLAYILVLLVLETNSLIFLDSVQQIKSMESLAAIHYKCTCGHSTCGLSLSGQFRSLS